MQMDFLLFDTFSSSLESVFGSIGERYSAHPPYIS
ncbi:hypothetical protein SOVF_196860 [Spinacia oleracea]|nr:hypothetical protein SOVF_196860 [Spinacia oleracea]